MSLLKLIFGRRAEPPPPPPPPRGDSLTLTGAGLADADTSLAATVTVTFGDRTFTAKATRRGSDHPAEFALTEIHEPVAAPEPVAPPPPPPPPPPAPEPEVTSAPATPEAVAAPAEPEPLSPPVEEVIPDATDEVAADEPGEAADVLPAYEREIAVVRRPITDSDGEVVGYELVAGGDGVRGTAELLVDVFGDVGIARLAGRHPAWVSISPEFLLEVGTPPVRPDRVVLQIPAQPVSDEVLTALRRLQFSGYILALEGIEPRLLQVCSIVKVPLAAAADHDLGAMRARGLELVATDVATPEALAEARNLGFTKFQGNFFAQPDLT